MDEKFGIATKKIMTAELKEKFEKFPDFVVTNYKGLNAQDIEGLRRKLIQVSSAYFIVKNSLAKRVFSELNIKGMDEFLKGEIGIGFMGDLIAGSKTLIDFSKEYSALKVNCAFINGKIEEADRIKYLATLPSRETLIAMAIGRMKAPINGFVGVLGGLLRNLVYAINEIKNKKGKGGE